MAAKSMDGTWLALGAVALVGGAKLAVDRLGLGSRNDFDDDEPSEDEDDFDLKAELESGVVIGEARGGYSLSADGRHLETIPHEVPVRGRFGQPSEETLSGRDVALRKALQWMEDHSYWPNLFYVNERGNVDLLDTSHRTRKVGGQDVRDLHQGQDGRDRPLLGLSVADPVRTQPGADPLIWNERPPLSTEAEARAALDTLRAAMQRIYDHYDAGAGQAIGVTSAEVVAALVTLDRYLVGRDPVHTTREGFTAAATDALAGEKVEVNLSDGGYSRIWLDPFGSKRSDAVWLGDNSLERAKVRWSRITDAAG